MDNTVKNLEINNGLKNSAETKCGLVALIGPANSGKSSLVNALVGNKVSIVTAKEQTTRFNVLGIRTEENSQIIFVDTPGFLARRYRGALSRFIALQTAESTHGCDIIVLVLDIAMAIKDKQYIKRALDSLKNQNVEKIDYILLNKIDLIDKIQLLPVIDQLRTDDKVSKAEIIPISVKKKDGLKIIDKTFVEKIPFGPYLYGEDKITNKADYVIVVETVREKLTHILQKELPYSLVALLSSWEKEEQILKIGIDIIVDKESQKRIVIGKGARVLKEVGTRAREELEKIFETKIFLNLKVKVKKDWTKDPNKVEQWHLKLQS